MKSTSEGFILSNGKEFYANCSILGINDALDISYGYDGGVCDEFTKEERQEIAKYMIGLWKKFAKDDSEEGV